MSLGLTELRPAPWPFGCRAAGRPPAALLGADESDAVAAVSPSPCVGPGAYSPYRPSLWLSCLAVPALRPMGSFMGWGGGGFRNQRGFRTQFQPFGFPSGAMPSGFLMAPVRG